MLGVTTMLNFFTTSNGFRSNLPVVSNLTAMNLWDAVCMGFIYTSFLEFVVVNYLARWVQDPDIQKRKRDNAILDVSMRSAWQRPRPACFTAELAQEFYLAEQLLNCNVT